MPYYNTDIFYPDKNRVDACKFLSRLLIKNSFVVHNFGDITINCFKIVFYTIYFLKFRL